MAVDWLLTVMSVLCVVLRLLEVPLEYQTANSPSKEHPTVIPQADPLQAALIAASGLVLPLAPGTGEVTGKVTLRKHRETSELGSGTSRAASYPTHLLSISRRSVCLLDASASNSKGPLFLSIIPYVLLYFVLLAASLDFYVIGGLLVWAANFMSLLFWFLRVISTRSKG